MVLEQLFKVRWLERKAPFAFLIGAMFTIIGIISAKLIFGKDPSMMAVAFIAILLVPTLNKLLAYEENVEIREKKFHFRQLFKDHKDVFEIYIFLFLGIFLTFALLAFILRPDSVQQMFPRQLSVAGLAGQATGVFGNPYFWSILGNNLLILFVCLVLSFIYGAGAILFIVWNASVWGVIFGYVAKMSAVTVGANPFLHFWTTLVPTLPHLFGEGFAYLIAAIVGGVVSKGVIREDFMSPKFKHIVTDALIFLAMGFALIVISAYIEVAIFL